MKKFTFLAILVALLASCSSYERLGSFTSVSTRNMDSKTDYVILSKYTTCTVKAKKAKKMNVDPLTFAAEECVKEQPGGEFLRNVKFYRTKNGKTYKIEGDIWGFQMQQPSKK